MILDIRLVNGDSPWEGRVEVFHEGAWGTVTDDNFDINDARVICRSLGYGGAAAYVWYSGFGQGTGTIAFDELGCNGDEASIFDCSKSGPDGDYHFEDAGVRCQGEGGNIVCSLQSNFYNAHSTTHLCLQHYINKHSKNGSREVNNQIPSFQGKSRQLWPYAKISNIKLLDKKRSSRFSAWLVPHKHICHSFSPIKCKSILKL